MKTRTFALLTDHIVNEGIDRPMTQAAIAGSATLSGVARLLGHRFGDGLVYFTEDHERNLFNLAVEWGLITGDGYITPEGQAFIHTHGDG